MKWSRKEIRCHFRALGMVCVWYARMRVSMEVREQLAVRLEVLLPHLSEHQQRLALAVEARLLGHGGVRSVAQAAGVSETTVRRGVFELEAGEEPFPPGRVRRPGGGRKAAARQDPTSSRPCWRRWNRTNAAIRCRRCGGRSPGGESQACHSTTNRTPPTDVSAAQPLSRPRVLQRQVLLAEIAREMASGWPRERSLGHAEDGRGPDKTLRRLGGALGCICSATGPEDALVASRPDRQEHVPRLGVQVLVHDRSLPRRADMHRWSMDAAGS
jgi:hypothetical protein